MILQSLNAYYRRKCESPDPSRLPTPCPTRPVTADGCTYYRGPAAHPARAPEAVLGRTRSETMYKYNAGPGSAPGAGPIGSCLNARARE